MPRAYPHSHMCHGQLVGFSVKLFGNEPTYYACYRDPSGRRMKRDTNQTRQGQAVEAARLIIEAEYAPLTASTARVTWDEAVARLTARLATSSNRDSTLAIT